MATKQFGVEAVVKGLGKFLSDIGKINSAYDSNSKAIKGAQSELDKLGQKSEAYAKRTIAAFDQYRKTTLSLKDALINYGRAFDAVTAAKGKSAKTVKDAEDRFKKMENALQRAQISAHGAKAAYSDLAAQSMILSQQTNDATNKLTQLAGVGMGLREGLTALKSVASGAGVVLAGLGVAANVAKAGLNVLISVFKKLYDAVAGVVQAFGHWLSRVSQIASAILFADLLRQIARGVRELSRDVIEAAGEFQRLQIQFEGLIARDIVAELGIPFKQAFSIAGEYAERLLLWVQRLAVQSPFTVQSIARTLAMANAFGLAIPLAQDLTVAVGNFAAGMGLTDDHMERIVYNFGQMAAQGKLTGREFRDLAISFVPMETLIKQMADEAGMAAGEFRKLALEGGVPVQQFFDHFIKFSQEAFPGAAERMTKTLTGLINKIKDFAQVVMGMQVLGPVLQKITSILSGVVDRLLSPEFLRGARIIGETLSMSFDTFLAFLRGRLIPAIGNLGKAFGLARLSAEQFAVKMAAIVIFVSLAMDKLAKVINNIAKFITEKLGGAGQNSGQWGYNLVANFAKGMGAAVKLIVKVITHIAKILSSWFKPGSPPRIAPYIDKWGEETIGAYTGGMAKAAREKKGNTDPFKIIGANFKDQAAKSATAISEAGKTVVSSASNVVEDIGETIEQIARRVIAELSRFSAEAMTGLVKGFSSADFDIFESISGLIERFLRALPTGNIGETELIPRILGTRETIANAVSNFRNGLVGIGQAIDSVLASAVNASAEFNGYIRALFNAEAATKLLEKATREQTAVNELSLKNLRKSDNLLSRLTGDVRRYATEYVAGLQQVARVEKELEAAQADLNRITEYYNAILDDLKSQLSAVTDEFKEQERLAEIQAAINTGLLTEKELARLTAEQRAIAIRQQIRETEKQRDIEVGAAEARVDAATEAKDTLNAQLEEQREFLLDMVEAQYELAKAQSDAANEQLLVAQKTIEVQIKQNELIQEQIDLLNKLADKGRSGGGGGADEEGLEEPFMPAPIDEWDLPEIEDISAEVESIFKQAEKLAGEWFKSITGMFEDAFGDIDWQGLGTSLGNFYKNLKDWWDKDMRPLIDAFSKDFNQIAGAMGTNLLRIDDALQRLGITAGAPGLGDLIEFFTFITGAWFLGAMAWFNDKLEKAAAVMESFADTADRFRPIFEDLNERFKEAQEPVEKLYILWEFALTTIEAVVYGIFGAVVAYLKEKFWYIVEIAEWLYERLVGGSIFPEMMEGIRNVIVETIDGLLESWSTWAENIRAKAEEKWEAVKTLIKDKIDAAKQHVETTINNLKTWWETTWEAIRKFVDDKWVAIQTLVETAALAVKGFIEDPIGTLQTWWETTWGDIKSYILGIWNDPDGIVQKIITAVDDLVTPIQGKLSTALDNLKTKYLDPLAQGFRDVGTAISGMIGWVDTIVQRLLQSDVAQALARLNPFKKQSPPPLAAGFDEVSRSIARFSNYAVPMLSSSLANVAAPALSPTGSAGTTINRNITINVDANYAATQSPVGIYHDVTAALMSVNNR